MDNPTFLKLADECLEKVATWLEDFDPDLVVLSSPHAPMARDAFLIMLNLPLALIGALPGLYFTNNALGFMPQLGILSLFGIGTCGDVNHLNVKGESRGTAEIGTLLAKTVAAEIPNS